ncbi:uncharacterized protein BDZ83DRAFT_657540 [Colletotrichum acutatum]|uniref:Uncharacterized protein n=1 Tax=Glomerella acutata TaxID=27357 RepID=A0AAD8U6B0_GLOAC|nr:uncharacterized protein BDZ83DRAFT_657540 [Colletotrichum acutatum]KAK1708383.1 hypothetical protein BDZ83DRAFT_657540 [Colletotrichum acutatum]
MGAFEGLESLDIIPRKEVVLGSFLPMYGGGGQLSTLACAIAAFLCRRSIADWKNAGIAKTIPVVLLALFELVLACVGGGDAVVTGAPATDELVVGDELDGSGTMLDDNVDVSAARGVLDVEASVTGGTGVEDRATLNVDVTKVVGCVEEVGGGSGGSGRGEEVGRLAVDEGGAGAPFGRLLIERTRTLTMDDDIMLVSQYGPKLQLSWCASTIGFF